MIPQGYAAAHFPHTSQAVTLQRPGENKKWQARLFVRIRKDRSATHVLTGHWSDFVQDNHLQEGDICIFHPLKTAGIRFALMVHLIRQTKLVGALQEHGNSPSSPGPEGGTSSSRGKTPMAKAKEPKIVHSVEGSKAKAKKVTPVARVKDEPAADQAPSPCNCHLTDDESSDSGGPSEAAGPYIMASNAHLTDEQRKKVEDIVGSIQSQVPIYVAVMNKTNVAATGTCTLVSSSKPPLWQFQLLNACCLITHLYVCI